jgi:hypothetical protein
MTLRGHGGPSRNGQAAIAVSADMVETAQNLGGGVGRRDLPHISLSLRSVRTDGQCRTAMGGTLNSGGDQ